MGQCDKLPSGIHVAKTILPDVKLSSPHGDWMHTTPDVCTRNAVEKNKPLQENRLLRLLTLRCWLRSRRAQTRPGPPCFRERAQMRRFLDLKLGEGVVSGRGCP